MPAAGGHKATVSKMHGKKNAPTLFPLNSVYFNHGSIRISGHEFHEIFVRATNSAPFVHFVFNRFSFAGFDATDPWHIYVASSEEATIYIPVNRFFTVCKLIRVIDDNMAD